MSNWNIPSDSKLNDIAVPVREAGIAPAPYLRWIARELRALKERTPSQSRWLVAWDKNMREPTPIVAPASNSLERDEESRALPSEEFISNCKHGVAAILLCPQCQPSQTKGALSLLQEIKVYECPTEIVRDGPTFISRMALAEYTHSNNPETTQAALVIAQREVNKWSHVIALLDLIDVSKMETSEAIEVMEARQSAIALIEQRVTFFKTVAELCAPKAAS